jgi:hypothetical protein
VKGVDVMGWMLVDDECAGDTGVDRIVVCVSVGNGVYGCEACSGV